jgi:dipeptidyl aminopeptidase/acylaminoacyl peptidase
MQSVRQFFLMTLVGVFAVLPARGAATSATGTAPVLVYERHGDLHASTVDGSRTVRLTATKLCECEAALSSDGRSVTYVRARSVRAGVLRGGDGVWTMRIDGSTRKRLTSNGTDRRPAWSADQRTIYFERELPPPCVRGCVPCSGLFRIGSDGRGFRRLDRRNALGHEFAAAPAPDAWHLAYVAWTGCEGGTTDGGVRIRHLTRSGLPIGTPIDFFFGGDPAWSPDSRRLALIYGPFFERRGLAIMNRDGSDRRLIVSRKVNVTRPKWSPDGQWLMFASAGDLVVVRADGSVRKRVMRTPTVAETPVGWLTGLP